MVSSDFPNKIADACLQKYAKLPKSGKPQKGKEWTLLSAVLITTADQPEPRVVALATGSKCIGRSKLSSKGDVLNDSHAEVLARRSFLRYLYHQIELVLCGQKSEIIKARKGLEQSCLVKEDVKFHFYTSHTPCGDASIFSKLSGTKRKAESDNELLQKKLKGSDDFSRDQDIHRTGAKCVSAGAQDPKGQGVDYHIVGALRTKPGRGDPTLSMSCSDKMAKWNVCGLQGALLARLLKLPLYLDTITVGSCPYCSEAMSRALVGRSRNVTSLPEGYRQNCPQIFQSSLMFECSRTLIQEETKDKTKVVPCSASIIWSDVPSKQLEVSVNGRRQGVTSKSISEPSARLATCKAELFKTFIELNKKCSGENECAQKSYLENKKLSATYGKALAAFRTEFSSWTEKPESLSQFTLSPE